MHRTKLVFLSFFLSISTYAESDRALLDHLTGQFNEQQDQQFVSLDKTSLPVNKKGMYLQKEVVEQLNKAYTDFKKEHPNVPFVIVSATRNYNYQNQIWRNKWNAKYPLHNNAPDTAQDILQFSSMPGTSRHHWGTDFDITSVEPSYFTNNADGIVLNQWLQENMEKYGFCQPYTAGRNGGYKEEAWHWSYTPISKTYLQAFDQIMTETPEKITERLSFNGHDEIPLEGLIREFVFTIDDQCR